MIIKSLGRKASTKMSGGGRGKTPFDRLVQYMTRNSEAERSQKVLWHGFYGHDGMSDADIAGEFERNARKLPDRRNGNILYHEILSFSSGYALKGEALAKAVADIGQEYLRHRAPNQMAFGALHWDSDHVHLHLCVSANAIGKSSRVRLSKKQFADIQKTLEAFVISKYPDLQQTRIYDRDRPRERLKTQTHEQAMKSRTGKPSRKEQIKSKLHSAFERAATAQELARLLHSEVWSCTRVASPAG